MVRYRQGVHPQFPRPVHQPIDPAGAIEQAVVGMDVKMNETLIGGRHG